jgi:hypothetical protein
MPTLHRVSRIIELQSFVNKEYRGNDFTLAYAETDSHAANGTDHSTSYILVQQRSYPSSLSPGLDRS